MSTAPQDHDAAIAAVVPRAVAGDRRAIQELLNLIHPAIVRYCRGRVGDTRYPTADDIAQEILLAVVRALPDYVDIGAPFMAFVYRIASNKIVDARRAHSRDHSHPVDEVPDTIVTVDTPENGILELDACNEVAALLDLLSDKARDIVTLRVFGGYSAEETARIVGTSPGAVRVAQHRALAKLRTHMEQNHSEHPTPALPPRDRIATRAPAARTGGEHR